MNRLNKTCLLTITILLFTSRDFINNAFTYKSTTESFVESLIVEDYDRSLTYMATEHERYKSANLDTIKVGLSNFRKVIVNNFGNELEYKFMTANKTFSTVEGESTEPNTTKANIQFTNNKEFGVFEIEFEDNSNKILTIQTANVKKPIPNMLFFWLFGVIAICVPVFNIWVIRKIKKSDLKKKWLKYIAVMFLNIPAIIYSAVYGLSFSLLNFQILFGISFEYTGYINSAWTFGIPLGGIYWLWKLNKNAIDNTIIENELISE